MLRKPRKAVGSEKRQRLTVKEREAAWGVALSLERQGFPGYAAIIRLLLTKLNV